MNKSETGTQAGNLVSTGAPVIIDQAVARLALIQNIERGYKDDEPFVAFGSSVVVDNARLELSDCVRAPRTHPPRLILLETACDLAPSIHKTTIAGAGVNRGLMPCKPDYGDTFKRAFDFVGKRLSEPGRF